MVDANTGAVHDPRDENGEFVMFAEGWKARKDRRDTRRRMANGRVTALLKNKPGCGAAPCWLKFSRDNQAWGLVDRWVPHVRRIFALCIEGHSLVEIAALVDADAVKPPKGKRWNWSWVGVIIRHPAAKGEYSQSQGGTEYPLSVPPVARTSISRARSRRRLRERNGARSRTLAFSWRR